MIKVFKETAYDNFNDTYDDDYVNNDYENEIVDFPELQVSDYKPKSDWSGFILEVEYSGDALSDYTTSFIVKADSKQQAINKLKKYPDFRLVRFCKSIDSILNYKKSYPYSTYSIIE